MNIRLLATVVFALALGGCTVTLAKDSVVLSDAAVAARKITLPDKPVAAAALAPGARLVTEDLTADFGTLHTVRLESDPAKPLIVFCGGNLFREEKVGAPFAESLAPFGDVLFFDYPGYGASSGSGTRAEFAAAEKALLPRVETLTAGRTGPLIFWGHSLGGGVCASLAANAKAKSALVLAATFARYDDIKDNLLGWFSGAVDLKPADDLVIYDTPELLKNYAGPIVVVALSEDETIPYKVSRRLADQLREEGRQVTFVTLEGSGHSRIHGHHDFKAKVKAALKDAGVATGE
jgi:pimeloyl-ACP methyl ester carboxylesterase